MFGLSKKPKANTEATKGGVSVRNTGEQAHKVSYKDLCEQAKDMLMRKPVSNQFSESDEIKDLMNWNKLLNLTQLRRYNTKNKAMSKPVVLFFVLP